MQHEVQFAFLACELTTTFPINFLSSDLNILGNNSISII